MRVPRTKAENLELFLRGRYGNQLRTWPLAEFMRIRKQIRDRVVMRYAGTPGRDWERYGEGLESWEVRGLAALWILRHGADPGRITVNELARDSCLILQGEVQRTPMGLYLRYSTRPVPMRQALDEETRHATGLEAVMRLKAGLDPSSYDDLMEILEDFDGAVVEFSAWSECQGTIPGRNTVVWEVRAY